MIERRLIGRRFMDYHPDAPPPLYPTELERRRADRRTGAGVHPGPDALLPGCRRRPRILFSGILKCARCKRELRRTRNLSSRARRHFIAEHTLHPARPQCECGAGTPALEWLFQAGAE